MEYLLFVLQLPDSTLSLAGPMETSTNVKPLPPKHSGKLSLVIDRVRIGFV